MKEHGGEDRERLAYRLPVEQLARRCDPSKFPFATTDELEPLRDGIIGQPRAVQAMEFGLSVPSRGYNLFLTGPTGTGKTTYAQAKVRGIAQKRPSPPDWCYVYNFAQPDHPRALAFPPGQGARFRRDMDELIEELRTEISRAFDSEQYETRRGEIISQGEREAANIWRQLEEEARQNRLLLQRTPTGVLTVPLTPDGRPLTQEQFASLSEQARALWAEAARQMQARINDALRRIRKVERSTRQALRQLERETGLFAAEHLIQGLKEAYADNADVVDYLDQVKEDVVEHLHLFRREPGEEEAHPLEFLMRRGAGDDPFLRYRVNLFVSHAHTSGAPVIVEPNPTYYNLMGRVEYQGELGTLRTNFMMIKPGALHLANGGYLILQARDLLTAPGAWQALKRALKTGEIRIESLADQVGVVATTSLRPQPIPLDVKIILIGDALLYYLLYTHDEDFRKYFKIQVDFDTVMDRSEANEAAYAAFISAHCRREGLLPFDRTGVARIIEYSSRLAGHRDKLSTRFNDITEMLTEACVWARNEGAAVVSDRHVVRAIEAKIYRSNRLEESILELIQRGTFLLDVDGYKVGQVNGIAVLQLGDYAFGKPARITARVYLGSRGVINIEREADLSGPIHSKGVLILSAYLAAKFAQDKPLSLSASLAFEQSYDEVDGDSASMAELCALLSELSGVPLHQGIGVTGSVNQKGEIQPIGGVNEKIEGFYHACKSKGLTGRQGVLIPKANVENLMLKDEVIEAVANGLFHIYAVETVEEAIEVLTGKPAGEPDADGVYPEGTVYALVDARLREMARRLQEFGREDDGEGEPERPEERESAAREQEGDEGPGDGLPGGDDGPEVPPGPEI